MRNQYNRHPFLRVQFHQHVHDLTRGFTVQVTRRLICQNQCRMGHQGASDRNPLLLSAGELGGMVALATCEADALQGMQRESLLLTGRHAAIEQR